MHQDSANGMESNIIIFNILISVADPGFSKGGYWFYKKWSAQSWLKKGFCEFCQNLIITSQNVKFSDNNIPNLTHRTWKTRNSTTKKGAWHYL